MFKQHIKEVKDFPKAGVNYKDITSLLLDGDVFSNMIDEIEKIALDIDFDLIVAPEARGFIVGCPLATKMKKPFIPVRKANKLPREKITVEYNLEYGTDGLSIHKEDLKGFKRAIITDDLLATGGTIEAIIKLLKSQNVEVVGIICVIELEYLNGKETIGDIPIYSLVKYE